jgi:FtsZ-binding cell division protein ZapB
MNQKLLWLGIGLLVVVVIVGAIWFNKLDSENEDTIQNIRNKLAKETEINANHVKKIESLEKDVAKEANELRVLTAKYNRATLAVQQAHDEMERHEKELNDVLAKDSEDINTLKTKLVSATSLARRAEEKLRLSETARDNLRAQLEQSNQNLAAVRDTEKEVKAALTALQASNASTLEAKSDLEKSLTASNARIRMLTGQIVQKTRAMAADAETIETQANTLRERAIEIQKIKHDMQTQANTIATLHEQIQHAAQNNSTQVHALAEEVKTATDTIARLQRELHDSKTSADALQQSLDAAREETDRLQEDLDKLRQIDPGAHEGSDPVHQIDPQAGSSSRPSGQPVQKVQDGSATDPSQGGRSTVTPVDNDPPSTQQPIVKPTTNEPRKGVFLVSTLNETTGMGQKWQSALMRVIKDVTGDQDTTRATAAQITAAHGQGGVRTCVYASLANGEIQTCDPGLAVQTWRGIHQPRGMWLYGVQPSPTDFPVCSLDGKLDASLTPLEHAVCVMPFSGSKWSQHGSEPGSQTTSSDARYVRVYPLTTGESPVIGKEETVGNFLNRYHDSAAAAYLENQQLRTQENIAAAERLAQERQAARFQQARENMRNDQAQQAAAAQHTAQQTAEAVAAARKACAAGTGFPEARWKGGTSASDPCTLIANVPYNIPLPPSCRFYPPQKNNGESCKNDFNESVRQCRVLHVVNNDIDPCWCSVTNGQWTCKGTFRGTQVCTVGKRVGEKCT